jgi:hypothetical protein
VDRDGVDRDGAPDDASVDARPLADAIHIRVGDLIGWAGAAEIRSAFAGTLEGVLVLPGERVVPGQPVAWLRAYVEDGSPVVPRRPAPLRAPGATTNEPT